MKLLRANQEEVQVEEPEFEIQSGAIAQIERAQIDMQIATARKFPRQLSLVKQRMLSFATLDEETAAGCFYTLPGRKGGDGKPLQGPSVRLAEIALSCYQHLRAGSRVIEDDGKFITAQGVVHDLENNVVISIEVKRRVTGKDGRRYSDDMIATTGNAACSIALRNAAFRVIPMALVKPVYEAAKSLAIGDSKSLVQRRAACVEHFAKMGVNKESVCKALEVRSVEDIQLDHIEILLGYATAIKDGDTTVDEIFNKTGIQTVPAKIEVEDKIPMEPPAKPAPMRMSKVVAPPPEEEFPTEDAYVAQARKAAENTISRDAARKPKAESLTDLMERDGISEKEVIAALVAFGVIKAGKVQSIAEVPAKIQQDAIQDWNSVLDNVAIMREGGDA